MKKTSHFFVMAIVIMIGMMQPMELAAQSSQDWATAVNALSGKPVISAQAASFQKFGSYPVNKATGIPDVSIPIYTVKSGSLEFPITLAYHMGGIKVEEIASWVGLGWNLSAGGVISRTVRGIPDESNSGWLDDEPYPVVKYNGVTNGSYYKDYTDLLSKYGFETAVLYHTNLRDDLIDQGSDIYTYSIGGVSGKFVYDFDRNMVQIPYSDNKIERDGNNFTITDSKGVRYVFTADQNYTEYGKPNTNYGSFWVPMTWLLSEIISADGLDSIQFQYSSTADAVSDGTRRLSVIYGRYWNTQSPPQLTTNESQYGNDIVYSGYLDGQERLLTSIIFRGGRVDFTTDSRSDMRTKRLYNIVVKDNDGTQIKKVVFNHSYFQSGSGTTKYYKRLKLANLAVYGKIGSPLESYTFDYNSNTLPPYYSTGDASSFRRQDYWGYYNGNSNSSYMIPAAILAGTNITGKGFNRNSSESAMKACVLNKITYPTGGYTLFETEANSAPGIFTTAVTDVGGLRIKEIKSYTSSGDTNPLIVSYTYEDGHLISPSDQSLWKIDISFSTGSRAGTPADNSGNTYPDAYSPGYSYPMAPGTIYLEDPISPLGQYQGSPVIYGKVTEIRGGSNAPAGKTVYEYDNPRSFSGYLSGYNTGMEHDSSSIPVDWANGHLKKMTTYRKEGSTYVKIKETENTYAINAVTVCHGTMVMDRAVYQGYVGATWGVSGNVPANSNSYAAQYFYHYWVTEETGTYRLTSTTEREFTSASDTQGRGTITSYVYGNDTYYLPSQITVTALPGSTQLKQTNYVYAPETYSAMATKNMLNYPYEETVTGPGNTTVFKSRITYTGSNTPKPYQIFKSYNSTLPTSNPDITISQRDSYGNVCQTQDRNGVSTVYLWGYKGEHLVCEIVNATYSQVSSALGSSSIAAILTASKPTTTHFNAMKALQTATALSNAQVTVYEYDPLVGVKTITDPSERKISYTYDSSNRLYEIRDHNGNLVQRYQYNTTAN
jgi:YD repeat-containing protein